MRYCRECAQPLADGRADKQFCSSTCRVKAHRSTRLAAAAQLKGVARSQAAPRHWARSRSVRPVTATAYRSVLGHAVRAFGGKRLGDVTRVDVERLAASLDAKGRSARTCSLTLFVVRSILGAALDDGLVVRNVASKVAASGRAARTREALSADDLATLRAHIATTDVHSVWLLVLAGLRRSEVLGLRWSDVDMAAGTLTIARGMVPNASGGRAEPTDPKTERGARTLPLPADMLAALRSMRERQASTFGFVQARDGYLATDPAGVPLRPERLSDLWADLCRDAGVPAVTLHCARHSSVSILRARGVDDASVAAWHGHDETTMRRTYSHITRDQLAAVGQALSAAK